MQGSKERRIEKYGLSKIEFDNIKGFYAYWQKQPEYENLKECKNFAKTKEYFTKWTLDYLMKFYPNIKYKTLEFKASFILENKDNLPLNRDYWGDTVAFKFQKGRPEIYLLIQKDPMILDEARFDAYELGPFIRPKWEE